MENKQLAFRLKDLAGGLELKDDFCTYAGLNDVQKDSTVAGVIYVHESELNDAEYLSITARIESVSEELIVDEFRRKTVNSHRLLVSCIAGNDDSLSFNVSDIDVNNLGGLIEYYLPMVKIYNADAAKVFPDIITGLFIDEDHEGYVFELTSYNDSTPNSFMVRLRHGENYLRFVHLSSTGCFLTDVKNFSKKVSELIQSPFSASDYLGTRRERYFALGATEKSIIELTNGDDQLVNKLWLTAGTLLSELRNRANEEVES